VDQTPTDGIRCPHCNKKLGAFLKGIYVTMCPGCKELVVIDSEVKDKA
jgi:phage FluMu protein Com